MKWKYLVLLQLIAEYMDTNNYNIKKMEKEKYFTAALLIIGILTNLSSHGIDPCMRKSRHGHKTLNCCLSNKLKMLKSIQ